MLDRFGSLFQSRALIGSLSFGVLALAGISGCQSGSGSTPSDQIELGVHGEGPSPIDSVSTRGLEIRLWVVDDTDWAAFKALRAYTDIEPSPINVQDAQRWDDWGFRLVAMPIGDVEDFLGSLRSVQPNKVQWLGEFGQWRAVVRAGAIKSGHVRIGTGSDTIELGNPRMIVRSWVEPILSVNDVIPMVRLDLGLQIELDKTRSDPRLLGIDRARTIDDAGPIIDDLLMSIMLDGSQAVVLVGDAPGSNWDHLPEATLIPEDSDADEPTDSRQGFGPGRNDERESVELGSQAPITTPSSGARQVHEPKRPELKSLGELMLTSSGSRITRMNQTRIVPKRVVVVFVPRVDGGWSLLGATPDSPTSPRGQQ